MEIPYEVSARRDTGLYNAKIGVWLFLASEVMLFGGLFSAYVFLRAGIDPSRGDIPWPVSVQNVWLGFINTLVLIASSVFVVMAWVSLKERSWNKFRGWMTAVILCAVAFLGIKSFEYSSKFKHHGIVMKDGSVLEGEVVNKTDRIAFAADSVSINLMGGLPGFHKTIHEQDEEGRWRRLSPDELPDLKDKDGKSIGNFRDWFFTEKNRVAREMAESRRAHRRGEQTQNVDTRAVITAGQPFTVFASPFKLVAHGDDSLAFRDGTTLKGALKNDTVDIVVHQVDLQMVPFEHQGEAQAWEVVNDSAVKQHWFEQRDAALDHIKQWYESRDQVVPREQLQSRLVSLHNVHPGGEKPVGDHPGDHGSEDPAESAASGSGGAHDHATISVPREKVKFLSAHTPRYHTYYAIYFTMTGLHGLHVIGGALVLAYFLFFGKKLFLRNPEHLANRVEVGGLFWHFVDLIWIFLFPIMYLF